MPRQRLHRWLLQDTTASKRQRICIWTHARRYAHQHASMHSHTDILEHEREHLRAYTDSTRTLLRTLDWHRATCALTKTVPAVGKPRSCTRQSTARWVTGDPAIILGQLITGRWRPVINCSTTAAAGQLRPSPFCQGRHSPLSPLPGSDSEVASGGGHHMIGCSTANNWQGVPGCVGLSPGCARNKIIF